MKNIYALSETQIEALASERTRNLLDTDRADGTYLRALISATQAKLGAKRGKVPSTEAQLAVLEPIAVLFYAAVLRGVTTDDIAIETGLEPADLTKRTRERNRRATFARSAKSTLVSWVEAGGDMRALDVQSVTKTELRTSVRATKSPGDLFEHTIERAQRRIIASINAQARASPDVARARLEALIEALQETLDELPEADAPHHDTTTIRTRVGQPTFTEPRVLNRGAT